MDRASKRDRVERIDDEVNELHPLLESIFREFPEVQYVEYTHGPNEKGADFVIERRDDTLGTTNFIGVVAKADKILQSFADVERQIDECGHPRLIKNGVQKVRLPEVWVVTSKSVSHNAKEKIEEKFPSKKIHFFDADWLVDRIDQYAPHFWEEIDNCIGKYLSQLDKRLGIIGAQTAIAATQSTRNIHLELDVEEIETDRYLHKQQRSKRPRLVNIDEELLGNKVSVLEAEMGHGKSHLARRIASHFADVGTFKSHGVVPIYAPFKAFAESDGDVERFAEFALGKECYRNALEEQNRILLILDGIDEALADPAVCRTKTEDLIRAIRTKDKWHLLLTSRPWRALGEFASNYESVKRYAIRPVSLGKLIAYLRQVFEAQQLPNRLIDDLAKSGLFKQLPQNPMAATLLANIMNQERYELPSSLTELYAKTVELMLGRWDEKRLIATEKQYKANERLARLLAKHMIDNQLVYMSKAEVKQMFQAFLADRQTGIDLEETYEYLINRSTLFGVFEDTDAVFFRHRSFAEYLYARDAYETRNLRISERAFEPYWINIFFFYIGSRAECPELIDELVALQPADIPHRVHRMLNMGNYMMAGFQTPYSHIQKGVDKVLGEAARLYLDIRHGRVKSSLQALTEMQLLWVFAQSIRHYYGYEFFKSALPVSLLKIEEELPSTDESRPFALFFAACALADVGDNSGFQIILDKTSVTSLPVQVSLALRYEMGIAKGDFSRSKPVKEFDRKLKKLLNVSADKGLEQGSRMHALFHAPISASLPKAPAAEAPRNGK